MRRVAGSRSDGVWAFSWPLGSSCLLLPGTYHVKVLVIDAAGRQRRMPDAATVIVTGPDRRRPSALLATPDRLTVSSPLRLSFDEDVTDLSSESAVIRRSGLYRGSTNEAPAGAPGTWSCATVAGAATDCLDGTLRTAVWTPAEPLVAGVDYSLDFNPEHVLSLTDLSGNPLGVGVWTWAPRA